MNLRVIREGGKPRYKVHKESRKMIKYSFKNSQTEVLKEIKIIMNYHKLLIKEMKYITKQILLGTKFKIMGKMKINISKMII